MLPAVRYFLKTWYTGIPKIFKDLRAQKPCWAQIYTVALHIPADSTAATAADAAAAVRCGRILENALPRALGIPSGIEISWN